MRIQLPFMGETMECVMCGKQHKSDPHIESNWRAIQLDTISYYVCPKHFPPDETGTTKQFSRAYQKVLKRILAIHGKSS